MSPPLPESTDPPDADESDDAAPAAARPSEATLRRARQRLRQGQRLLHLGIFAHRTLGSVTASAILVRKTLRIVLRVMVDVLSTATVDEDDWEALVDQALQLDREHRWLGDSFAERYATIHRWAEGFDRMDLGTTKADRRAYRRTVRRLPSLVHHALERVEWHRRRLPEVRRRRRRRWVVGLMTAAAILAALGTYPYVRAAHCITGQYFAGRSHERLVFERRDCAIDFDWGPGLPGEGLSADHFSVRWSGRLQIDSPGLYTFELSSDDGSRLFVAGQPVVDHWYDHGFSPLEGTIRLPAGLTPFRVEYYERDGLAAVRWSWRKDGGPFEVVPRNVLLPP